MEPVTAWKLVALAALLLLALLGGAVPLFWKRLRDSPVALSHLNAFSGGVFLAMALGHLLPDAVESFAELNVSFRGAPYTIALAGYLSILFVEKIVVDAHAFAHAHGDEGESAGGDERPHQGIAAASDGPSLAQDRAIASQPASAHAAADAHAACSQLPHIAPPQPQRLVLSDHAAPLDDLANSSSEHETYVSIPRLVAPGSPLPLSHPAARRRILAQAAMLPAQEICCDDSTSAHLSQHHEAAGVAPSADSSTHAEHQHAQRGTLETRDGGAGPSPIAYSRVSTLSSSSSSNSSATAATPLMGYASQSAANPHQGSASALKSTSSGSDHAHDQQHNHHHHHDAESPDVSASASAYVLMIALSLHSVFEGIALGLQDTTSKVFTLGLGLVAHKWVEAIALATSLIKSKRSTTLSIVFMVIFSLATPLGIGAGIILSLENSKMVEAAFTAVACGSFLYVGANEVVAEEFEQQSNRRTKFASLLFGMGLIIYLTTFDID
jgi:zinc transporter ZupT